MRLGLFGGTFDPLHNGHLIAASDALTALALDRVVLIPAAVQPLKAATPATAPQHRLAMVRGAIGRDGRFDVDALEIDRSGLSFTVDTLETYAARHPADDLFLIVGADVLATFDQWRLPDRIRELATLAVLERSGGESAVGGGAQES
ncbi:MAG TPA: nicotinate (nicotinamide) nucleotide adenylyltransferase, partial [Gemmatimonadaceae bacterium]|nr:nicotinate (nicotinamide) nucleotide adenylyltransferase [Gemmatimonadaceae bacterium]